MEQKKIKIVIIILAVLLALSLTALGGTILYHKLASRPADTVTVPDNFITPDEEPTAPDSSESRTPDEGSEGQAPTESAAPSAAASTQPTAAAEARKAATIALYSKQPEDNTPFASGNLFPGDAETKCFCVRVSYHDKITVHYRADVRPGYEKLAEVLNLRVVLLNTGETLYDGLMRDMPASVTHKLASRSSATDELYYEITAYLDTSVGNDYQNKDLIADFRWWVEETGKLDDSPKTGDASGILLWAVLAAASGCTLLLLLFVRRRKEEEENV